MIVGVSAALINIHIYVYIYTYISKRNNVGCITCAFIVANLIAGDT